MDAEAALRYERARSGHAGIMRYAHIAIETAIRYDYPPIRITADGCADGRAAVVIASNMSRYAGWLTPSPGATPFDGLLDLVPVRYIGPAGIFVAALRFLLGLGRSAPRCRMKRVTSARWESARPVPLEVDGEPAGWLPVDVTVRPGAARFVVPAFEPNGARPARAATSA